MKLESKYFDMIRASRRAPDILWTHDDSGGAPILYAVDTTGRKRGALYLKGASCEDWEDVASFERAGKAVGINPVGQSGVLFDKHYADQAERFAEGIYVPQHLSKKDVAKHSESTLTLEPAN